MRKRDDPAIDLRTQLRTLAANTHFEVSGRRPVSKYRTQTEMRIAVMAPFAAEVQIAMIHGDITLDETLFACCERIIDRICGRAPRRIELQVDGSIGVFPATRIAEAAEAAEAELKALEVDYRDVTGECV